MREDQDELEYLWDNLLSRNPQQILKVFIPSEEINQKNILEHLNRMVHEPDWHPEQRRSAQFALDVLRDRGV